MEGPASDYGEGTDWRARPSSGTAGADEPATETEAGQVHGLAGLRGFDHRAGANVHGDMLGTTRSVEEEIAGLEITEGHRGRIAHLSARVVGEADTHLTPGIRR